MSSLPDNGTYKIKNIGAPLATKFLGVNAANALVMMPDHAANLNIRWILKDQTQPGTNVEVVTLQSALVGANGSGFWAPQSNNNHAPILYTNLAETISVKHVNGDAYNLSFAKRRSILVMEAVGAAPMLTNLVNPSSATQTWRFVPV